MYTHNLLPHGKDLQEQELESDLKEVVDIFIQSVISLTQLPHMEIPVNAVVIVMKETHS